MYRRELHVCYLTIASHEVIIIIIIIIIIIYHIYIALFSYIGTHSKVLYNF